MILSELGDVLQCCHFSKPWPACWELPCSTTTHPELPGLLSAAFPTRIYRLTLGVKLILHVFGVAVLNFSVLHSISPEYSPPLKKKKNHKTCFCLQNFDINLCSICNKDPIGCEMTLPGLAVWAAWDSGWCPCPRQRNQMSFNPPSNSNHSGILWFCYDCISYGLCMI